MEWFECEMMVVGESVVMNLEGGFGRKKEGRENKVMMQFI